MNRAALCIKMLHILYGRNNPIQKKELAERLDTNPRNISEFKKELEIAGYVIKYISGRYGGYILKEEGIFPSLSLDAKEKEAINEATKYLKTQENFLQYQYFDTAMGKLKAKSKDSKVHNDTIYLSDSKKQVSRVENQMIELLYEAKKESSVVSFYYSAYYSDTFHERKVHPYEIIVNKDGFYILAYDITANKKKDYKFFKIVEERMKEVHLLDTRFVRDQYFKAHEYIGKQALMKDLYEVELEITGVNAKLINEKEIENVIEKRFQDKKLYLKFMMAGNLRLKSFILSLGKDCKVIAPISIRNEIYNELLGTISLYKKRCDKQRSDC